MPYEDVEFLQLVQFFQSPLIWILKDGEWWTSGALCDELVDWLDEDDIDDCERAWSEAYPRKYRKLEDDRFRRSQEALRFVVERALRSLKQDGIRVIRSREGGTQFRLDTGHRKTQESIKLLESIRETILHELGYLWASFMATTREELRTALYKMREPRLDNQVIAAMIGEDAIDEVSFGEEYG
jgi:hypothetical protein